MRTTTQKVGVAVVGVLVLVAACLFVRSIFSGSSQTGATASSAPSTPHSKTSPTIAPSGSTSLEELKATLNQRIAEFCQQYYARSPELSAAQIRRSVQPYATADFMAHATFGYGNSQADQSMQQAGRSLKVVAVSAFNGELSDDHKSATGTVTVYRNEYDSTGALVPPTRLPYPQFIALVRMNGVWLVEQTNSPTT